MKKNVKKNRKVNMKIKMGINYQNNCELKFNEMNWRCDAVVRFIK